MPDMPGMLGIPDMLGMLGMLGIPDMLGIPPVCDAPGMVFPCDVLPVAFCSNCSTSCRRFSMEAMLLEPDVLADPKPDVAPVGAVLETLITVDIRSSPLANGMDRRLRRMVLRSKATVKVRV